MFQQETFILSLGKILQLQKAPSKKQRRVVIPTEKPFFFG
jgi:hypothetical protein